MIYNEGYLVGYGGKHNKLCRNMGLTVQSVHMLLIAFMQGDMTRKVPIVSQIAGRAVLDICETIQKHNSIIPDLLRTRTHRLGKIN